MTAKVSSETRERVEACLKRVEADNKVSILFAVESGSRAWGFPSPDSDYDVRFVYVRPIDWYLSLTEKRGVIERPIVDDLDVSGWDIKKALALLLKGNPALLEWLCSPIVYRETEGLAALRTLAERSKHRQAAAFHYRCLAHNQMKRHILGRTHVNLKKYLYCIRPAGALLWLRTNKGQVPMDLPTILHGVTLPPSVDAAINRLLTMKAEMSELGEGGRIPAIDAFVEQEIAKARTEVPEPPLESTMLITEAEILFRRLVLTSRSQSPFGMNFGPPTVP